MHSAPTLPPTSLTDALRANTPLWEALHRLPDLGLPDWYLGGGCIAQTFWNHVCGMPPGQGILDYDIVYFDPDLSREAERMAHERAETLLADFGLTLDVKNQARVHLWYRDRFGYDIVPYRSTCDAIATWPTTAGSVGVRVDEEGILSLCAPFTLDDLLHLVVRPNRAQVTRDVYDEKTARWSRAWPRLVVLPWE